MPARICAGEPGTKARHVAYAEAEEGGEAVRCTSSMWRPSLALEKPVVASGCEDPAGRGGVREKLSLSSVATRPGELEENAEPPSVLW